MPAELTYEQVLRHAETQRLEPFYLFFGPSEFLREALLSRIRETCVDEAARDLNLRIFYGDKGDRTELGPMLDYFRSLPFIGSRRIAIVRRADGLSAENLEGLVPYLENPVPTTSVIFVASSPDFRKTFFKSIRNAGKAVNLKEPGEARVPSWIHMRSRESGFEMDADACGYLIDIVGVDLMSLNSEIEKLAVRYPGARVGVEEVREIAVGTRNYTIFELMDAVSSRRLDLVIPALRRFLEVEHRDGVLRLIGMLAREIGLLIRAKAVVDSGGNAGAIEKKLKIHSYPARKLYPRCRLWSSEELEKGVHLLYRADGRIKSGAGGGQVIKQLLTALCTGRYS